eukprot:NODE_222_length_1389_cov_2890.757463_g122_i0.p2 GENE.NODE_222_length_1389_cov_2890.757463_g122_i0~~NODE_222_length_1389_cov_2890.757463_g122_i0.p2  ORF type:complete len:170 (-),score=56.70 NODE_222_length_1389_cov_2890.757463_g122_i0:473-982(-)
MDRTHNRPSLRRLLQHLPSLLPNWAPHRRRTSGFGSTNCNCRHPNQASKDCEDTASWLDWDGDSCSSYYQNHWCVDGEAPSWVEGWANVEGVDATKACCGCGPSLCGNIHGWLDSDGDSCSLYYQNDWCVDRVVCAAVELAQEPVNVRSIRFGTQPQRANLGGSQQCSP